MSKINRSQFIYIKAIAQSVYSLEVENSKSVNIDLAVNRLSSALWMLVLQDCDSFVEELCAIEEKLREAYDDSDHAAILSYSVKMQLVCQRAINELDAE